MNDLTRELLRGCGFTAIRRRSNGSYDATLGDLRYRGIWMKSFIPIGEAMFGENEIINISVQLDFAPNLTTLQLKK